MIEGHGLLRHEDGGLSRLPVTMAAYVDPETGSVEFGFERYGQAQAVMEMNVTPEKAIAFALQLARAAIVAQIAQRVTAAQESLK